MTSKKFEQGLHDMACMSIVYNDMYISVTESNLETKQCCCSVDYKYLKTLDNKIKNFISSV